MARPGEGFFTVDQYQRAPENRVLSIAACGKCKLHKQCIHPKMKPTGKGRKKILIVAEAPGKDEDERGKQLVGKAGKYVRKILRNCDIDLERDCRKINAVNCRPPDNATPTAAQIDSCRPNVMKEVKRFKPKLIIPMGGKAVQSLLGHRFHEDKSNYSISRWRGWAIPDQEWKTWITPTFHPSYIQRMEGNKAIGHIYEDDVRDALKLLRNYDFPELGDVTAGIECLTKEREICQYLRQLLKNPPTFISIDYETTGLKPHAKGHDIRSCSISTSPFVAVAFLLQSDKVRELLVQVLQHPLIQKFAHNMKFEETWSRVILGTEVVNWALDTMILTHCLDNRRGITGLKFQTYIRYGVLDYSSHISPLLKAKSTEFGANGFNRVFEIPIDELLTYNGVDTKMNYRLAMDQLKQMGIFDPEHTVKKYGSLFPMRNHQ